MQGSSNDKLNTTKDIVTTRQTDHLIQNCLAVRGSPWEKGIPVPFPWGSPCRADWASAKEKIGQQKLPPGPSPGKSASLLPPPRNPHALPRIPAMLVRGNLTSCWCCVTTSRRQGAGGAAGRMERAYSTFRTPAGAACLYYSCWRALG